MDYEDMDEKIRKYNIHTAIFCSPYNPCAIRMNLALPLERVKEAFARLHTYVFL